MARGVSEVLLLVTGLLCLPASALLLLLLVSLLAPDQLQGVPLAANLAHLETQAPNYTLSCTPSEPCVCRWAPSWPSTRRPPPCPWRQCPPGCGWCWPASAGPSQ